MAQRPFASLSGMWQGHLVEEVTSDVWGVRVAPLGFDGSSFYRIPLSTGGLRVLVETATVGAGGGGAGTEFTEGVDDVVGGLGTLFLGRDIASNMGRAIAVSTVGRVQVDVIETVGGGGGGTEFTEGTSTVAEQLGTLVLGADESFGIGRAFAVSTVGRLQIDIVSGGGGGDAEKAEDTAHASGDIGNFVLGVRNDDAATANIATNANYGGAALDEYGRLFGLVGGPRPVGTTLGGWNPLILGGVGTSGNIVGGIRLSVDGDQIVHQHAVSYANQDAASNSQLMPVGEDDSTPFIQPTFAYHYNGTTWDRVRTNQYIAGTSTVGEQRGHLVLGEGPDFLARALSTGTAGELNVHVLQDSSFKLGRNVLPGNWSFDTDTGGTPLTGTWERDNTDPGSATEVYIHETTADSGDASAVLALAKVGDFLAMQNRRDTEQLEIYRITSVTDDGDFHTYGVTLLGEGETPMANGAACVVVLVLVPTFNIGSFGVGGNATNPMYVANPTSGNMLAQVDVLTTPGTDMGKVFGELAAASVSTVYVHVGTVADASVMLRMQSDFRVPYYISLDGGSTDFCKVLPGSYHENFDFKANERVLAALSEVQIKGVSDELPEAGEFTFTAIT
jgi:hypothetical protein